MADTSRVYVGTVGQSIWRSRDGGLTFTRASAGAPMECDVRALLVHPDAPEHLHLGTEAGLFVSRDGADHWEQESTALAGTQVWSLARDPRNPDHLLAGTCPAALYRSEDGGRYWQRLDVPMPEQCVNGAPLTPRVTCILFDPHEAALFVGIEVGGIRRSRDDGRSWEVLGQGLSSQDIHGLASVPLGDGRGGRVLLATTNNDVNRSVDDGETWTPLKVDRVFPWPYTRACVVPPHDPHTVWIGAGNGPPGNQGALYRTSDAGNSWERLGLPQVANSTMWSLAFHPADPRRIYAASISGQLYRSLDGGDSWSKLPMEFGEIRALAWTPG